RIRCRHGVSPCDAAAGRILRGRPALGALQRRPQRSFAAQRGRPMTRKKIKLIFERFKAANPKPTTELEYRTPFELLIAVILSAQATDKSVNQATRVLFKHANTPEAILALGVEGLSPYIRTIGLFNSKAKNIIATC